MPEDPVANTNKARDSILEEIREGFTSTHKKIDGVIDEAKATNLRITQIENWKDRVSERLDRHSTGSKELDLTVRQVSEHDAKQQSQLSEEIVQRINQAQSIEDKVDLLAKNQTIQLVVMNRIDSVFKKPITKLFFFVLASAFIQWAVREGIVIFK